MKWKRSKKASQEAKAKSKNGEPKDLSRTGSMHNGAPSVPSHLDNRIDFDGHESGDSMSSSAPATPESEDSGMMQCNWLFTGRLTPNYLFPEIVYL